MASITERSTKAEILAAYHALQAAQGAGPSWGQVWAKLRATGAAVIREAALLARDTQNTGALVRQWVSGIVDELRQPVLRYKA